MQHASSIKGPFGDLLTAAVKHSSDSKELIEEVLYERMLNVQPKFEKMLPFIALTAGSAPLLGLLGTVTGMINTFKLITVFGTGDARSLSSGISEALVTTEFGLYVAIPALLLHAVLNRKAKGLVGRMEQLSVGFINGLRAKA
jgi:biopolymer transport protein ExbB